VPAISNFTSAIQTIFYKKISMKQLLITAAFFGFYGSTNNLWAQDKKSKQTETIIIEGEAGADRTVIELRDGDVVIDGKKVAPYTIGRNLKIIKKLGKNLSRLERGADIELNLPDGDDQDFNSGKRAMLGISTAPSPKNNGAIVEQVNENSPAELSGLQKGDIIVKVDAQTINSPQDLVSSINSHKPGDKVEITYQRNNKEKTLPVILSEKSGATAGMFGDGFNMDDMMKNFEKSFGNMDGKGTFKMFRNGQEVDADAPKIGAAVEDRADEDGVRVTSITDNSIAQKAGIKVEDVINSVGGNSIRNIDDLSNALSMSKNKKDVPVIVKRGNKTETLYLTMPVQLRKKNF
jgi:serine protease Do